MASDIRFLRKFGSVRAYVKNIAEKFAMYRSLQGQVETPQYKTHYRTKRYDLIFREEGVAYTAGTNKIENKFTYEPDGQFVTIMHTFELSLHDQSGFENHAYPQFTNNQVIPAGSGHPTFPAPVGNEEPMPFAIYFRTEYDKLWIPAKPSNQVVFDTATGFSVFIRCRPLVSALDQGVQRVLWCKMDDLDNAAMGWIRPLLLDPPWPGDFMFVGFVVRKGGVEFQVRSNLAILPGEWCDIWFIWDNVANKALIWINGCPSDQIQGDTALWNNSTNDWIIGHRTYGTAPGGFVGVIDKFFFYRNKVVTIQEVFNMYMNGCTIANIIPDQFTGVSIIGKSGFGPGLGVATGGNDFIDADFVDADFVTGTPPQGDSFDDISFDTTSFA